MPEKDLSELPYSEWLEDTLQCLINLPTKGILICSMLENGDIYSDSYKIDAGDTDRIICMLQRENTLRFLRNNNYIHPPEDE